MTIQELINELQYSIDELGYIVSAYTDDFNNDNYCQKDCCK